SEPPATALEIALDGIHDDGVFSQDTALAAFVASFGPLPGVNAPVSTEDVDDGTLAIRMVSMYWSNLTDAQRAAIIDWTGADPSTIAPASYHASAASTINQAVVDQAHADIAAHVGHRLGIPIIATVATPPRLATVKPNARAWTIVQYDPSGQNATTCRI